MGKKLFDQELPIFVSGVRAFFHVRMSSYALA